MNQMRFSGIHLIILCIMLIAAGVIITATKWPFRSALFPVVIGISVFFIGLAALLASLFKKEEIAKKQDVLDFEFSEGVDKAITIRRTFFVLRMDHRFLLIDSLIRLYHCSSSIRLPIHETLW